MKRLNVEILDVDSNVIDFISVAYLNNNFQLVERFISAYRVIDDTVNTGIYGTYFDKGSNVYRITWNNGIIKFTAINEGVR